MIEIVDIVKEISGKIILSNVNFVFKNGKIFAIYGKNGSGKTSLLNVIAGVDDNFYGEVFSGEKIGYVVQFVEHMVCKKDILLEVNSIVKSDSLSKKILVELGLYEKRLESPFLLSEGEKRLLFVKSALEAFESILLDEPFANLDKMWEQKVGNFIRNAVDNGKLVIYTANRLEDCKYADLILELKNGKLYQRDY